MRSPKVSYLHLQAIAIAHPHPQPPSIQIRKTGDILSQTSPQGNQHLQIIPIAHSNPQPPIVPIRQTGCNFRPQTSVPLRFSRGSHARILEPVRCGSVPQEEARDEGPLPAGIEFGELGGGAGEWGRELAGQEPFGGSEEESGGGVEQACEYETDTYLDGPRA